MQYEPDPQPRRDPNDQPFRERAEFLRGRAAEQRIAAWLKANGWFIIPAYDYSGPDGDKAPIFQGATEGIVLPDLGIARAGLMKWAEVKAKKGPSYTVITGENVHGIGLLKWRHYLRCQRETGAHVLLFIWEECKQTLLVQSLDVLGDGRIYKGDRMDKGGMVFWPRDRFDPFVIDELPGLFDPGLPLPF